MDNLSIAVETMPVFTER